MQKAKAKKQAPRYGYHRTLVPKELSGKSVRVTESNWWLPDRGPNGGAQGTVDARLEYLPPENNGGSPSLVLHIHCRSLRGRDTETTIKLNSTDEFLTLAAALPSLAHRAHMGNGMPAPSNAGTPIPAGCTWSERGARKRRAKS